MTDFLLQVNGLAARYGEIQVLWDVSLCNRAKEITAILGSNGAGKSTLMKTLAGIIRPVRGQIIFSGKRIDGLPPHRVDEAGLSLVPEGRRLFPQMTVLENLEMGAYARRARNRIRDNLEFVLRLFPILKERRDQLAGTLSGGEQQMLAIARGLMSSPDMLMLDEPSLGLAPKVASTLFQAIKEINAKGMSILMAEQNVREALGMAQNVYVMETGRIILSGTPESVVHSDYLRQAYLGV